ncbi:SWEET16 [Symbiodinium sp. CCMP2592]|nr:SWEET16 [Symbiodinium sp. CCMP2592]
MRELSMSPGRKDEGFWELWLGPKLPPTALGKGRLGLLPQSCWFGGTASPTHLGSLGGRLRSSLVAVLGAPFQVLDAVLTLSAVLTAASLSDRMGWLDHEALKKPRKLSLSLPKSSVHHPCQPQAEATEQAQALQAVPAQPEGQPVQYAIPAGYQAVAVPAMDPAQYTAWLQALQAQQVVAQQMFAQQLAGVAGGAAGVAGAAGLYAAVPTVPGVALPTAVAAPASEDSPAYSGQIVDYNEDKGFGFIECKDTQQIYGKDIFLLRSSLNGLIVSTGDRVSFKVETGIKGPKAVEVEIIERIADMAERLPTYWGRVKNFDAARGLGFIDCEETKEVYEKDILVLRSQLGDHSNDTIVSFNIVEDARGVKAANVKIHPDGYPPGKEPKKKGKGKGMKGFEMGFGDGKGWGKGKGIDVGQLWQAMEMLGEIWNGGVDLELVVGMPTDHYHVLCQGPPLFPDHLRSCEATKVAPTGMVLEAVRRRCFARVMKIRLATAGDLDRKAACNILSIGYGLQISNAAVLMTNLFGTRLSSEPTSPKRFRVLPAEMRSRGLACQILFFAGEHYIRAADAQWLPFAVKTSVILNGGIVIARSAPMNLLGQFITVFNIFLYSCPLMNLGAVLRTRNSSPFPSFMVGINVVNNALWSIYALLIEDVVVLMPSILGYACSFFQVLLILWCRNRLPFDLSFLLAIIQKTKPRASEVEPSTPESDHLAEASEEQDGNEDWL